MVQVVTGTHGGETLDPLAWKYKLIVATSIKRMFCFVSFPDSGFFCDVYTHSPAHTVYSQYNNNNNHLTAVCPGQPGYAGTRRNIHWLLTVVKIKKHKNILK